MATVHEAVAETGFEATIFKSLFEAGLRYIKLQSQQLSQ